MKRMIDVISSVIFVSCTNIYIYEELLFLRYAGQKIELDDEIGYYFVPIFDLLGGAPINYGKYVSATKEAYVIFEINLII
ncbi:hypothetical protein ACTQ07_10185 [Holdemanella porci]|uniref:hypothetical protein n=1 Tax=Holdemanella porci TaxID=2652276 RepID=UPI003F9228CE